MSLNQTWNTAHQELERKDVGDFEKKELENTKVIAKRIMEKLGAL